MTRLYDDSFENLHKLRFFFIENSWPQLRKFLWAICSNGGSDRPPCLESVSPYPFMVRERPQSYSVWMETKQRWASVPNCFGNSCAPISSGERDVQLYKRMQKQKMCLCKGWRSLQLLHLQGMREQDPSQYHRGTWRRVKWAWRRRRHHFWHDGLWIWIRCRLCCIFNWNRIKMIVCKNKWQKHVFESKLPLYTPFTRWVRSTCCNTHGPPPMVHHLGAPDGALTWFNYVYNAIDGFPTINYSHKHLSHVKFNTSWQF